MKRSCLHINENYRGFVVRKLKSMARDRIRIFLTVSCAGVRMNRQHKDVSRISEFHLVFRTEEY
jgi:hypothetical protein